jgi:hypothetical protein
MKAIIRLINAVVFLIRGAFLIFGLATVLDGALPSVSEQLQVQDHHNVVSQPSNNAANPDAQYLIHFSGDKERSCSVDDFVYNSLRGGDVVTLRSSHLLHHCLEIRRGDITVVPPFLLWKWCSMGGGLFCILAALFGKVGFVGDNDPSVGIHIDL